jgi:hypothetical protein
MHASSMAKWLAPILFLPITSESMGAEPASPPQINVSFDTPVGWSYEVRQEVGRARVTLKPRAGPGYMSTSRCQIDRLESSQQSRKYTQEELNSLFAAKPFTEYDFKTQLKKSHGETVEIVRTGRSKLGASVAYWAQTTSSEVSGLWKYNFRTKVLVAPTPGYDWTVTCLVIQAVTNPDSLFEASLPLFDAFFSSIRFNAPDFR